MMLNKVFFLSRLRDLMDDSSLTAASTKTFRRLKTRRVSQVSWWTTNLVILYIQMRAQKDQSCPPKRSNRKIRCQKDRISWMNGNWHSIPGPHSLFFPRKTRFCSKTSIFLSFFLKCGKLSDFPKCWGTKRFGMHRRNGYPTGSVPFERPSSTDNLARAGWRGCGEANPWNGCLQSLGSMHHLFQNLFLEVQER